MKFIITNLLLLIVFTTNAQQGIDDLVRTEKSFAAFAVENGTRDAFLKFLDSTGVVFENGRAVNGIHYWGEKKKSPGILNWQPQFAEISASNDLGYTTGPWTYQKTSLKDSVLARGQYNTVWHKTKEGEWKFLVDIGNSYKTVNNFNETDLILAEKNSQNPINLASLVKAEEAFIKALKNGKNQAYIKFLSQKSILNHPEMLPVTQKENRASAIASIPSDIQLGIIASGIATSGDLGYVYGTAISNGKTQNYLHVWRREKAGWKLALDVLQY
jgi:ketosteroid isomerase-like protein